MRKLEKQGVTNMSVNGNIGAFITSADTIEIRFSDNEKLDADYIDENKKEEFKEFRENENKKEELDYYIQKILNRNKDLKNIDFEEEYDEYELTEDYDLDDEHDIDEKYIFENEYLSEESKINFDNEIYEGVFDFDNYEDNDIIEGDIYFKREEYNEDGIKVKELDFLEIDISKNIIGCYFTNNRLNIYFGVKICENIVILINRNNYAEGILIYGKFEIEDETNEIQKYDFYKCSVKPIYVKIVLKAPKDDQ